MFSKASGGAKRGSPGAFEHATMPGKVQATATMIEKLDGLPFAFGAKSFRQAGRFKWGFNTQTRKPAGNPSDSEHPN